MSAKTKVGIIGFGGFGQFLFHHWSSLPQVEVCAVADQREIETQKGVSFYRDYAGLLKDPAIEIVSIATPPSTHPDIAISAMRNGKHVLLEKPAALDTKSLRELLSVRDETGQILTTNYMLRYNPIVEALKRVVETNQFGNLLHVSVINVAQDETLPLDHWFWDRNQSGGILTEHAVHFFDLVRYVSGQATTSVHGFQADRNPVQQDRVIASILHADGLMSTHYHAFRRPGFFEETSMSFIFDLARIDVFGWIPMKGHLKAVGTKQSIDILESFPNWTQTDEIAINTIKDESRPEGWGPSDGISNQIMAAGIKHNADIEIHGDFSINLSKSDTYGNCVKKILLDMVKAIQNPEHAMRIQDADIIESIRIAETAGSVGPIALS